MTLNDFYEMEFKSKNIPTLTQVYECSEDDSPDLRKVKSLNVLFKKLVKAGLLPSPPMPGENIVNDYMLSQLMTENDQTQVVVTAFRVNEYGMLSNMRLVSERINVKDILDLIDKEFTLEVLRTIYESLSSIKYDEVEKSSIPPSK